MHAADCQTLFTHNHTIICFSLEEGLTSSSRAYHAGARCHKKDYCVRGFARDHDRRKLYIFIHFRRHRVDCSTQLDLELFSPTYGKTAICKSCDDTPVQKAAKITKSQIGWFGSRSSLRALCTLPRIYHRAAYPSTSDCPSEG